MYTIPPNTTHYEDFRRSSAFIAVYTGPRIPESGIDAGTVVVITTGADFNETRAVTMRTYHQRARFPHVTLRLVDYPTPFQLPFTGVAMLSLRLTKAVFAE